MRENSEVLILLIEEDDDPLLGLNVGGDEDWDMSVGFFCTEREENFLKAKLFKTIMNDSFTCFFLEVSFSSGVLVAFRDIPFMASRCL